jgi:hypothetical protein
MWTFMLAAIPVILSSCHIVHPALYPFLYDVCESQNKLSVSMSSAEVAQLRGPWRIGINVGGTLIGHVPIDSANAKSVAKVPSTPHDPSLGVVSVLAEIAKTRRRAGAALAIR